MIKEDSGAMHLEKGATKKRGLYILGIRVFAYSQSESLYLA